jgi:YYY domain-containing protein
VITPDDIFFVLYWLILLFFLHLSLFPLFRRFSPKVAIPLSFSISTLLFTLSSYWVVFLHFPLQVSLLPFLALTLYSAGKEYGRGGRTPLVHGYSGLSLQWRYYVLFTLIFFSMLLLRVYSPDISAAEKFMDHGFIASMMRNPVIPPLDPWFSGGDLSVYYFLGHWMLAAMGLITGVPSNILFTLALPTIAALAAVNMYGVGHILLPRFRLLPVVFLFLINPAFVKLTLSGAEWGKLLWESTRVIDGTINEYPLFSFIFGDVHAHVLGFLPQTTLILLVSLAITCWIKISSSSRIVLILSTGLALGSVPPTNTWDILIQAPLIMLTGVILLLISQSDISARIKEFRSVRMQMSGIRRSIRSRLPPQGDTGFLPPGKGAWVYFFLVPVIGILCYLPYYLMMEAQGIGGIGLVTSPSSLSSFFLVNGWFLLIIALSLIPVFKKVPWILLFTIPFLIAGYYAAAIPVMLLAGLLVRRDGAGDLLAGFGLAILIFCEILYLRDSMGDQYFRMNTVFKLYITAWLFFSAAAAGMLGRMVTSLPDQCSRILRAFDGAVPVVLLLLLLLPALVTITHAGSHTPTFDGLAWLSGTNPDDLAAVTWLRSQKGNLTIVEAEGGDYGYYSRVSAFTGIPTVIGWPFHESMWRKDTPHGWYGERTSAVRAMYEDPTRCLSLMKGYGADLLYVGPSEQKQYLVSLPSSGLKPVYQHGAVTIYTIS